MSEDIASTVQTVVAAQLRAFVERIERTDEDLKALNDDRKEIYSEARGTGFDVKALKEIVRLRKMDQAARQEAKAMLELYMNALGMA